MPRKRPTTISNSIQIWTSKICTKIWTRRQLMVNTPSNRQKKQNLSAQFKQAINCLRRKSSQYNLQTLVHTQKTFQKSTNRPLNLHCRKKLILLSKKIMARVQLKKAQICVSMNKKATKLVIQMIHLINASVKPRHCIKCTYNETLRKQHFQILLHRKLMMMRQHKSKAVRLESTRKSLMISLLINQQAFLRYYQISVV